MDRNLILEIFQYTNSSSITPIVTPAREIHNKLSQYTPLKKLKQIRTSVFNRPQSANISCKVNASRLLTRKPIKANIMKTEEIKPWSKSTSPFHSRPGSGSCKPQNRKIDLLEAVVPTIGKYLIHDTTSSMQTDQANISRYDFLNQECQILENTDSSLKDVQVFATEVPSFLHRVFPARKIHKSSTKKSSTFNLASDFPSVNKESKSKLPMKICYFNLKRRYYPVKYKLNYIPRHSSPYSHEFLKKSKKGARTKS